MKRPFGLELALFAMLECSFANKVKFREEHQKRPNHTQEPKDDSCTLEDRDIMVAEQLPKITPHRGAIDMSNLNFYKSISIAYDS
jgi:hypothetical protein